MTTFTFYGHTPPGIGEETTPGRLVVVEGTDGVRSTQIAMLQEWLESEGYAVLVTGFRRSELAASGIDRAMRGNTLDALTLNLFYATDFGTGWRRTSWCPAHRHGSTGGPVHLFHSRGEGASVNYFCRPSIILAVHPLFPTTLLGHSGAVGDVEFQDDRVVSMAAAVAIGLAKMCSHWEKTRLDVMPRDRRS